MDKAKSHFTYANVVATVALVLAFFAAASVICAALHDDEPNHLRFEGKHAPMEQWNGPHGGWGEEGAANKPGVHRDGPRLATPEGSDAVRPDTPNGLTTSPPAE